MKRATMSSASIAFLAVTAALLGGCGKKQPAPDRPAGLPPAPIPTQPDPVPGVAPTAAAARAAADEAEVVPGPPDASVSISGTVTLPAARRNDVHGIDTVFIIARRAGAPPGPGSLLAIQRHQATNFPLPFTLSARDAMVKGTPFEGMVDITVRLDKDGDGLTRRKGDLSGQANGIKVGSRDVTIALDTVLTRDQTLKVPPGGAPGGHGSPPSGMPPGHP